MVVVACSVVGVAVDVESGVPPWREVAGSFELVASDGEDDKLGTVGVATAVDDSKVTWVAVEMAASRVVAGGVEGDVTWVGVRSTVGDVRDLDEV